MQDFFISYIKSWGILDCKGFNAVVIFAFYMRAWFRLWDWAIVLEKNTFCNKKKILIGIFKN